MELAEVIALIDRPEAEWEVGRNTLALPWDIAPWEYLDFAHQDIEVGDRRGTVNALSNAKRALECQVDSLAIAFGLMGRTRRMNLPGKLDVLQNIALIAPKILLKINKHRNEMEHRYSCPPHDVVADFVDVVALFIEATKFHIHDRRFSWEFFLEDHDTLAVVLQKDSLRISRRRQIGSLEISASSAEYLQVLGVIGRVTEWQL